MRTLFCAAVIQVAAFGAADPALLNLVMPDAKVIAGLKVDQAKSSPFGLYVLTHMQFDDPDFIKFMAATGFDPRRDVREVVIAANGVQYDPSRWLVLAKGVFNPARIAGAAEASGGAVVKFHGTDIVTLGTLQTSSQPTAPDAEPKTVHGAIAFLDSSTAVMGDLPLVQATIARRKARTPASIALAGKVRQVSASNDFWFTTLVPLAQFAGAMPDPNLSGAMKGNLLGAVQQASGGLKFGNTVQVFGEAITRSPQDAAALVDVVKFIAGLIQTNRQSDKTAAQVSTLLDGLQTSAQGNVMTMNLAIPEPVLEQMISTMRQERGSQAKKPSSKPTPEKPTPEK